MRRTKRNAVIAGGAAATAVAAAAAGAWFALAPGATHSPPAAAGKTAAPKTPVRLMDSSCGGPAGAAYVMEAGYDSFAAINTADCDIVQSYNVGDPQISGDPGYYNYASTDEAAVTHGATMYVADTGISEVSAIDTSKLNPKNENPPETDIHVGLNPQSLAVTPDGRQLWVADTGPQTAAQSPTQVSVVDTATNKVTSTFPVKGSPTQIAFSPSGTTAYVLTSGGLWRYSTATRRVTGFTGGLGDPRGLAVSPDGSALYVTDTTASAVKVVSAARGRVTKTIPVGQMPWQIVVSRDGRTAYVANPDSDSVSVIGTAAGAVTDTIPLAGDPDTLALTPGGSQLWVGLRSTAYVTVIDTSGNSVVGSVNLGGSAPQSGDGDEPTGIALTSTSTPGS